MQSFFEHINSEILPQALMMGVNYELFWTLNPKSLFPFIRAFELSQDNQDAFAWQSGLYIKLAISSCLDSKVNYPKKPFTHRERITSEKASVDKMNEIKQKMLERMVIVNQQFQ